MQQRLIRVELGLKKSFLLQKVRKIIPSGGVVIDQLWGGVGGWRAIGGAPKLFKFQDQKTKTKRSKVIFISDMNEHCS